MDNLINLYIAENVLFYIGPTFYTTTILLYFKYFIHWLGFKIEFNFTAFSYSDMIARIFQIVGILYLACNHRIGSYVIVSGLFVQISLFTYVIFLQFKFYLHHHSTSKKGIATHIKMFSANFAAASILIIIRNIIRVARYLAHRSNYLNTKERILCVFTTLTLFLFPLIFVLFDCKYNIFSFKILALQKTESNQECLETSEEQVETDIKSRVTDRIPIE